MGISVSLLMVAVGAILRYAVAVLVDGVNLQTVGMILMIVGVVGAALSIANWGSWGGFRRQVIADGGARRTVVEETR